MTNEQNDKRSMVVMDVDDIVSPTPTDAMTLLLQDCGTSTSRTEFYMELQKQTWALRAVSLEDTPNVLESVPVTDFVTASMRLVDTINDSVILQFDPGETREELLNDRSDA